MATAAETLSLQDLPPDLLTAVLWEAARSAEMVSRLLDELSKTPGGEVFACRPLYLPDHFWTELAAALRLLSWESHGFSVHLDHGLPSAKQALLNVFHALTDPQVAAETASLPLRVFTLFMECFAWTASVEYDTDIALGHLDDEGIVTAIAEFLWNHRHTQ